jgi:ATP-dependent DNA helicase RecG
MTLQELKRTLARGEDSRHQFKSNLTNASAAAAEMVAMSNSDGGQIFVGVTDQGRPSGLTLADISRLNQLFSNASSQNVRPAVNPETENIETENGVVLVVTVPPGKSQPYSDQNGVFWVKVGADKRPASARDEILRLAQEGKMAYADEMAVPGTSAECVDRFYFSGFFEKQYGRTIDEDGIPFPQLLENLNLAKDGSLNLAGTLLFARSPEKFRSAFTVKAVAFPGTEIESTEYLDSRDIAGPMEAMYQAAYRFLVDHMANRQEGQSVNSLGVPEVPPIVWEELVANALVHRDYFISAPVRILVFQDRVEIVSPGHLPNHLSVQNILAGNSNIRNPVIASFAAKLLPYRGLGSGILRAVKAYPHIEFKDDREGNLFTAVVRRHPLSFLGN